MNGQFVLKSGMIGLLGLGCILVSMQVFGRAAVESNLHYFWYSFHQWLAYGLPQFIQSLRT